MKWNRRNGGYLSVGKLTARLEKEGWKAEGGRRVKTICISNSSIHPSSFHPFAVRTPTATVTDLGTEFGVEVDDQGVTESHVFRGAVRVQPCSAAHDGQKEIGDFVVRENESIRIEKPTAAGSQQHVAVTRNTAEPGRFVRELPPPAKSLPVHVWGLFPPGRGRSRRDARTAGK